MPRVSLRRGERTALPVLGHMLLDGQLEAAHGLSQLHPGGQLIDLGKEAGGFVVVRRGWPMSSGCDWARIG